MRRGCDAPLRDRRPPNRRSFRPPRICFFLDISSPRKSQIGIKTYSEIVDTIRDGLAAEFDAERVFAGVFDGVVNAECAVAVVLDVDVHVAVIEIDEICNHVTRGEVIVISIRFYLPEVPRMRQVTAPLPAFLALTEMQYSSPIDSVCWIPSVILQLSA